MSMRLNETTPSASWSESRAWQGPKTSEDAVSVDSFGEQFPARPLFSITAQSLGDHSVGLDGPQGRRSISRCDGGRFTGERLSGRLVEDVSNEWQMRATCGADIFSVEGLLTLASDEGETVLIKYAGRGGARYGVDRYCVGMIFEAPAATLGWLNDICACAYVRVVGGDLQFEVYELLGRAEPEARALRVDPLYAMSGQDSVGERRTIEGAVANRYVSMAETGCLAEGQLKATWLKGMSWGPHRMGFTPTSFPWQIDMRVAMRATSGDIVVQQYIGALPSCIISPEPDADRSWRTVAVFEAPVSGENAWLNVVVALGIGWTENNEAHYRYYALI